MPKQVYCLSDKLNLMEYKNKSMRYLISVDPGLVRVCLSAGDFKLTKIAREELENQLQCKKVVMEEYHVSMRELRGAINQRSILSV